MRIIQGITFIMIKIYIAPRRKVAYMYLFKPSATIERITSNACDAVADCYACKARATFERIFPNACYIIADCYTLECFYIIKWRITIAVRCVIRQVTS